MADNVLAFGSATISNTVVPITAEAFGWPARLISQGKAKMAVVTVMGADVMIRIDGGDPTTTVGHFIENHTTWVIDIAEAVKKWKAIRQAGVDATVSITLLGDLAG